MDDALLIWGFCLSYLMFGGLVSWASLVWLDSRREPMVIKGQSSSGSYIKGSR